MNRQARWSQLLDMLAGDGRIAIEPAAERLEVSAATIRRDLDELAEQQLLVRSRGGAVPNSVSYDLPMRYKASQRLEDKERIAARAAELVEPGMAVGLTGGTTATEVARALAVREDMQLSADAGAPALTVVTNAINIAYELAVRQHIKIVVAGGVVRSQSYELIGPLAAPTLDELSVDIAFIGVGAISAAGGAATSNEDEAAINRLLVRGARLVVVVADATKVGARSFSRICESSAVDVLVTTNEASTTELAALEDSGTEIVQA